jgi:hypothetical protein
LVKTTWKGCVTTIFMKVFAKENWRDFLNTSSLLISVTGDTILAIVADPSLDGTLSVFFISVELFFSDEGASRKG